MSKKLLFNLTANETLIAGDNLLHALLGFVNLPGNGSFYYNVNTSLTTLCKFKVQANGEIRLKTFYRTDNGAGADKTKGIRQIIYINNVEMQISDFANNLGGVLNADIQIKENDIVEIKYKANAQYGGHRVGTYVAICCGNEINSVITAL